MAAAAGRTGSAQDIGEVVLAADQAPAKVGDTTARVGWA
jgi:hypothetical protein